MSSLGTPNASTTSTIATGGSTIAAPRSGPVPREVGRVTGTRARPRNAGYTAYATPSATRAPIPPATPSSRRGRAVATRSDAKPSSVVAMLQKEPSHVSRTAASSVAPGGAPGRAAAAVRRQLAVRKTTCESVSTKTIVTRFAVSSPMPTPSP